MGPRKTAFMALIMVVLLLAPTGAADVRSPTPVTGEPLGDMVGPWWTDWSRDADEDRVDDELEHVIATTPPQTVIRVLVDLDHRPGGRAQSEVEGLGGSIYYICKYIDTMIVEIEAGRATSLLGVSGTVMLEADPDIEPALDSAQRTVDMDIVKSNWSYTGDGVVIAIVDTGIDVNHTGLNDLDDINDTYDPKVLAFYDAKNRPNDIDGTTRPYDDDGHGSHVAGIASGTGAGSPDLKYRGVAPNTKLVGIKVLGPSDNSMSDAMRGLEWARDNKAKYGIDILSLSFGAVFSGGVTNDGTSAISRLCDDLVEYGFIVVVAAGNSGPRRRTIAPPGDAKQVITVGNTYDDGTLHSSSSRGPVGDWNDNYIKPDVCAPGTDVYSVDYNTIDNYTSKTGTSMSAPFVSGLAAIMLEIKDDLTPTQVKTMLQQTAGGEGMSPLAGSPNNDYGYGIIRPYDIVNNLTGGVRPPRVTLDTIDPLVNGVVHLSGTASSDYGDIMSVEVQAATGGWNGAVGTDGWEYDWDTTGLENGPVEVRVRAYDGNLYSVTLRKAVTVNNLRVTVSIPERAEFRGNSSIKGKVIGLVVTKVEVRFDEDVWLDAVDTSLDGDWSSWQFDFDSKEIKDGKHTFRARAFDGYSYTESSVYTILIDNKKDKDSAFIPSFQPMLALAAVAVASFLISRARKVEKGGPRLS